MTFKKIIGKIHLWLGLSTGLVVFIIAITGCLYAFQAEIQDLTQPYRFVEPQQAAYLPPSVLKGIAEKQLPDKHLHAVEYGQPGKAAQVIFFHFEPSYYYSVYLNPYTGEVLRVKDMDADFFRIVLMGHYYLWLPPQIGQPLVASATLLFAVLLVSGIVLWWPKNKAAAKQRFWLRWKPTLNWKRKNYDLHNVLGFYASWIAVILTLTGLVWGFQWVAQGLHASLGGEKPLLYQEPVSDKSRSEAASEQVPAIDRVWLLMQREYPRAERLEVHVPDSDTAAIAANANADARTFWQIDYRYFDQYTLAELPVEHIYGRLKDAQLADKVLRMNYDIHVGAILGLPGKILAFFCSLVVASLPVTGFLIWWGRRKRAPVARKRAVVNA
ncbi:putative iron-regulated membrane protein [Rhabdobacter roseus]|uniref:Putative iron-regulated membrane protein n=1 Tax=Rhabdobacter roseus TaxID=1655419 RepID=A0A840TNV3_9BACT|nr:PepSY-associated TM helix domain-containing protein [Rhabdobacter roseus]MBB5284605.1 putative iron-regulated membrane protein [Rhabdobacter roseus]